RVDRVVAIRQQLQEELLRERARTETAAQLLSDLDHALAALRQTTPRELLSDHVRERERREAPALEKSDEFPLACPIATRDADDHGPHGPRSRHPRSSPAIRPRLPRTRRSASLAPCGSSSPARRASSADACSP